MVRACIPLLLALGFAGSAAGQADFAAAAAAYEASLSCQSLYRRALGMEAFAQSRDPRAFKLLAKRYAKPDAPPMQVRFLLASIFAEALSDGADPACQDVLAGMLKKHKKPADAWLQRCVYGVRARRGTAGLHAVAADARAKPFARAAALLALAEVQDARLLAALPDLLAEESLPKRGHARQVLVETCGRALVSFAEQGREALRPAAEAVIAQLDHKATDERTRVILARFLAQALDARQPVYGAEEWRALLAGQAPGGDGEGGTRVRPRFFSVTATGRKVAYVLDLSDSMLEPLGDEEVAKLRRAMPEVDAELFARNRFEATKLLLARSLQELPIGTWFGIVVFGSEGELLTPGMLKTNPGNVKKALAALEGIAVGPAEDDRPHGTLKGWTNLYGGLRLAFKLVDKGALPKDEEHVAEDAFEEGCDTIFLLSDGEPTWSDFEGWDLPLPDDVVGDGEGGGASSAADAGEEIQYYGPHMLNRFLYADLRRMNAFRHVQIHAIGIGEADPELLQEVAGIGLGSAHLFGPE